MRPTRLSLASTIVTGLVFAACGGGGSTGDDDGTTDVDAGIEPPAEGFRIQTTPIMIMPGEEVTYCYYTTIATARDMGIKRWSSTMTEGSHHLILYGGSANQPADGTVDGCGGASQIPAWIYSAQNSPQEALMPSGVGMKVAAGAKVYVQMHYLNTTEAPIMASVTVDADAYTAAETYIPAAPYVTYTAGFSIQPMSTGMAGASCRVPAGAKFFAMSTHAHKFSTHTQVQDGASMVFESANWEHPGARNWSAEPFYTFASGRITYRCDYRNDTANVVREGQSAQTNEMCMAVGYFFPAERATICVNGNVLPL